MDLPALTLEPGPRGSLGEKVECKTGAGSGQEPEGGPYSRTSFPLYFLTKSIRRFLPFAPICRGSNGEGVRGEKSLSGSFPSASFPTAAAVGSVSPARCVPVHPPPRCDGPNSPMTGPGARPELLSPKRALTALSRKRCVGRTLLADCRSAGDTPTSGLAQTFFQIEPNPARNLYSNGYSTRWPHPAGLGPGTGGHSRGPQDHPVATR